MKVTAEIRALVPTHSSVQLLVPEDSDLSAGVPTEAMTDQFQFLCLDGSPAETLAQILEANSTPLQMASVAQTIGKLRQGQARPGR